MSNTARKTTVALGELIEYQAIDRGTATIVLVSDSGGPIEGWDHVVDRLATGMTSVFAYNRAGIGESSEPSRVQAGAHLVESLRTVLRSARLAPPYALVGHRFGGLIVNLFARLYPEEVQSVVMVEAFSPQDMLASSSGERVLHRWIRELSDWFAPPNPKSESLYTAETAREVLSAPPFPAVPFVVISGARQGEANAGGALRDHRHLGPSTNGRHVVAPNSGRFPHITDPDVVANAVVDLLAASPGASTRTSRRLQPAWPMQAPVPRSAVGHVPT